AEWHWVDNHGPEDERGEEKPRVLDEVDARIEKSCVVQIRKVPRVEPTDIQRGRDERVTHRVDQRTHHLRTRERTNDPGAHHARQPTKQRTDWRAQQEEWRCNDREKHVLDHVPGEEDRRLSVDRWGERRDEGPEPEEEERRPPAGPRPPHPPHADRVEDRGEDADCCGD